MAPVEGKGFICIKTWPKSCQPPACSPTGQEGWTRRKISWQALNNFFSSIFTWETEKGDGRQETGERRWEKGFGRKEMGEMRWEKGDRRKEMGERSWETGERRKEMGGRRWKKEDRKKEMGERRQEMGDIRGSYPKKIIPYRSIGTLVVIN